MNQQQQQQLAVADAHKEVLVQDTFLNLVWFFFQSHSSCTKGLLVLQERRQKY